MVADRSQWKLKNVFKESSDGDDMKFWREKERKKKEKGVFGNNRRGLIVSEGGRVVVLLLLRMQLVGLQKMYFYFIGLMSCRETWQ